MDITLNGVKTFFSIGVYPSRPFFYALQIPIYYYVKRKGSLASQGINIISTIRMKVNVFEYYNEFYKDVYDKESYDTIPFSGL